MQVRMLPGHVLRCTSHVWPARTSLTSPHLARLSFAISRWKMIQPTCAALHTRARWRPAHAGQAAAPHAARANQQRRARGRDLAGGERVSRWCSAVLCGRRSLPGPTNHPFRLHLREQRRPCPTPPSCAECYTRRLHARMHSCTCPHAPYTYLRSWSALHYAAQSNQLRALKKLLLYGADPAAPNAVGETPLHIALTEGRWKVRGGMHAYGWMVAVACGGGGGVACIPRPVRKRAMLGARALHGHVGVSVL